MWPQFWAPCALTPASPAAACSASARRPCHLLRLRLKKKKRDRRKARRRRRRKKRRSSRFAVDLLPINHLKEDHSTGSPGTVFGYFVFSSCNQLPVFSIRVTGQQQRFSLGKFGRLFRNRLPSVGDSISFRRPAISVSRTRLANRDSLLCCQFH